MAIYTMYVDHQ